jgi:class 3 adenylate cyclase
MNNYFGKSLEEWAGAKCLNLALVFTDIVDSTAIGQKRGDVRWMNELSEHFRIGRAFASNYDCYVVKVIGDAFMIAFRNSTDPVNFSLEFSKNTGVKFIGIRVGIHSGQVQIMDNDIYGLNVNKAARIQSSVEKEGICVSEAIKEDFEKAFGSNCTIRFNQNPVNLKNFRRTRLWNVNDKELVSVYKSIRIERNKILGTTTQERTSTRIQAVPDSQLDRRFSNPFSLSAQNRNLILPSIKKLD